MKKLLTLSFLLFSLQSFSQEKIGRKMYLYGNPEKTIGATTAVLYQFDDPEGETAIIERFNKIHHTISWNSLFIPGNKYTDTEETEILLKNNVQSVIVVKIADIKNGVSSGSIGAFGGFTSIAIGSSKEYVGKVSLNIELFNKSNSFNEPIAVIKSEANNSFGNLGSQRGLVLRMMDRFIKSGTERNVFY